MIAAVPRLTNLDEMRRIGADLLPFIGDRDPINGFLAYFQPLVERSLAAWNRLHSEGPSFETRWMRLARSQNDRMSS